MAGSDEQSSGYSDLLHNGVIDPTLGELYRFEYVLQAHCEMGHGIEVFGQRDVLVGAGDPGSGRKSALRGVQDGRRLFHVISEDGSQRDTVRGRP